MSLPGGGHGGPGDPEMARGGGIPLEETAPTPPPMTHFDERGASRMVDISGKPETLRIARAEARVRMLPATLARVRDRSLGKGDVREVARIAGIQATKRTAELIPLCHPISLDAVSIDFTEAGSDTLVIACEARTTGRTGVEMEALTGATIAALTVYDMVKSIDRGVVVSDLRLLEKSGGRSGTWRREP